MTDEQIIKGLKFIVNQEFCNDCPLHGSDCDCIAMPEEFWTGVFNIINRQNAVIEKLKQELDGETVKNIRLGHEIDGMKEKNIDNLISENQMLRSELDRRITSFFSLKEKLKTVKLETAAEVKKELFELLNKKAVMSFTIYGKKDYAVSLYDIRKIFDYPDEESESKSETDDEEFLKVHKQLNNPKIMNYIIKKNVEIVNIIKKLI